MDRVYFNGSEFGYKIVEDDTDIRWSKIVFITPEQGRFTEWCFDDENLELGGEDKW